MKEVGDNHHFHKCWTTAQIKKPQKSIKISKATENTVTHQCHLLAYKPFKFGRVGTVMS